MKCYTVEYRTTNKVKEREFNDLSKAHKFAEGLWLWEGYDYIKLYDNTRESRKVIAEACINGCWYYLLDKHRGER